MGVSIDDLQFSRNYTVIPAGGLSDEFGVMAEGDLRRREYTTTELGSRHFVSHGVGGTPVALIAANPVLLDSANEPWPGGTHHQFRTVGIEIEQMIESVTASMPNTAQAQT